MNDPASNGDAAASTPTTVRCTGGEAVARALAAHGCGPIFGMGGFQLLPFYDAVRRLGLRHVLVNDERSAAFAADAYARVSGRVGVCDATPGRAPRTSSPAWSSDQRRHAPRRRRRRESRPRRPGDDPGGPPGPAAAARREGAPPRRGRQPHPELVRRAYAVATSGRPGAGRPRRPRGRRPRRPGTRRRRLRPRPGAGRASSLARAPGAGRRRVGRAARQRCEPAVLLAGGGVHLSGAHVALAELATALSIPVAHTISRQGRAGLHAPARRRTLRALLDHRQRPPRARGLHPRRRYEARRDRHPPLVAPPARASRSSRSRSTADEIGRSAPVSVGAGRRRAPGSP